jgi:uncharacterized protein YecE (DUF72 family)
MSTEQSPSAPIHLGCSSWQFEGWKGVFYPDKLPVSDQLGFYVRHFDTIEVNTSFYALPRPAVLVDWVETAPPGFTFCLKAWRAITHEKMLSDAQQETIGWIDSMRALGDAAAPGLLQLPPHLRRSSHGRALADYLDWLATVSSRVRIAVEVRASDLMTPAFVRFVAERGFAFALIDRKGQPDLFPLWEEVVNEGAAPNFALLRWIGDDRNGPQGDAEIQQPRDAELQQWAQRLEWLSARGVTSYGYMHNPYEGHSPESVRRLYRLLGRSPYQGNPPELPEDEAGQLTLFDT